MRTLTAVRSGNLRLIFWHFWHVRMVLICPVLDYEAKIVLHSESKTSSGDRGQIVTNTEAALPGQAGGAQAGGAQAGPDWAAEVRRLAAQRDAVILAHNYQAPEIQDIADHVGDSLALSRLAAASTASVIVFAGVYFMAETAKILAPY